MLLQCRFVFLLHVCISIYTPLPWQQCQDILHKQARRVITRSKKHISSQGLLNPVISWLYMEGAKDSNEGIN